MRKLRCGALRDSEEIQPFANSFFNRHLPRCCRLDCLRAKKGRKALLHCNMGLINSIALPSFLFLLLNIIQILSLKLSVKPRAVIPSTLHSLVLSADGVYSFCCFVLVSVTVAERNAACIQRTVDYHCCRFPFRYKGVKYRKCTNNGDAEGRFWCATVDVRDSNNETSSWGYCKCKLTLNPVL